MSEATKKELLQLIDIGPEIIPLDELCNVEKRAEEVPVFETRRTWFGWPRKVQVGTETAHSLWFGYTRLGIYASGFSVDYPSQEAMDAAYEVVREALRKRGQVGGGER